jgi:hypothetical protein
MEDERNGASGMREERRCGYRVLVGKTEGRRVHLKT